MNYVTENQSQSGHVIYTVQSFRSDHRPEDRIMFESDDCRACEAERDRLMAEAGYVDVSQPGAHRPAWQWPDEDLLSRRAIEAGMTVELAIEYYRWQHEHRVDLSVLTYARILHAGTRDRLLTANLSRDANGILREWTIDEWMRENGLEVNR